MIINQRPEIDGKYFNWWLYKNYAVNSIVTSAGKITIQGQILKEQEAEIGNFYQSLTPYGFEPEYMTVFLQGKYELNCERGAKYAHQITAKMVMLIESGLSLERANSQALESKKVLTELMQGHWHDAYKAHVSYEPIPELLEMHEEITEYLKEYVNNYYPQQLRV